MDTMDTPYKPPKQRVYELPGQLRNNSVFGMNQI